MELFKRKIYDRLIEWKRVSAGESAIMIEGARRIGKSTIAEEFAKNEYDDYMILDFALESDDVKQLFRSGLENMDAFFRNLFVFKQKTLSGKKCVIILDEIELFPLARQAIKYLVADGRYDYIETGSLIRIQKKSKEILIPSEEDKIQMFPMDFEEFLWAQGDYTTYEVIREAFENEAKMGDAIHRNVMRMFREYIAVGGMPQAVSAFVDGKNYDEIDRIKRRILLLYEEDLRKYDDDNYEKASLVFRTIPQQLTNKNSRFKMSLIDRNARYQNYINSVGFVVDSMMANECFCVTAPNINLESYVSSGNFKLYMCDTGLLITAMLKFDEKTKSDIYRSVLKNDSGMDMGMVFENVVAQMLRCSGHKLYYHTFSYKPEASEKEKRYELDFLTVREKKICPIEVKSSSYRRHASFDYFKKKYNIKMKNRYVIYTRDFAKKEEIRYIPVYMVGLI